jgi:hypothetical protein
MQRNTDAMNKKLRNILDKDRRRENENPGACTIKLFTAIIYGLS